MILTILAVIATSFLLAPLGCVLLWQRYNYFSDGLAHACLFSGVVSYFLHVPQIISMMVVSVFFALFVYILNFFSNKNSVINIVSTCMVALAIIFASKIPNSSIVETILFGDILSFTTKDLYILICLDIAVIGLLCLFLKDILLVSLNIDIARVNKIKVNKIELFSLIIISLIITMTIKNIGALLITALLVIPASSARIISTTPMAMIIYSILIALLSGLFGVYISYAFDCPLTAAIAIISLIIYVMIGFTKYMKGLKI